MGAVISFQENLNGMTRTLEIRKKEKGITCDFHFGGSGIGRVGICAFSGNEKKKTDFHNQLDR